MHKRVRKHLSFSLLAVESSSMLQLSACHWHKELLQKWKSLSPPVGEKGRRFPMVMGEGLGQHKELLAVFLVNGI